ncbi:MAG TPA: hypothetical protein VJ862_07855 [Rhodanobacteraceae bacterium]|nr:hypothetical protein [Rhodanobacteraceae bacterium]
MATKRNSKPAGKGGKTIRKTAARKGTPGKAAAHKLRKGAKAASKERAMPAKSRSAAKSKATPVAKPKAVAKKAASPDRKPAARPASVKTAAKAVAAARAGNAKRRPPSYIPRSRFSDDWLPAGPVELPRQPNPAAHTPTRKPPKPRAPKPKAISHEQAVANLKALLESRKRKDRGGDAGGSAGKGA